MEILDYKSLESDYGTMYHLLIDKYTDKAGIKFVSDKDHPKFATALNRPVFFHDSKEFHIATEFTIIYPKIYVKDSVPLTRGLLPLERAYIH